MAGRNDISGLLAFIGQEGDWRERLQEVVAKHLAPALEEFGVDPGDLDDLLCPQWSGTLWGCGFEDFLSARYDDDNIVDLYLKRRGGTETALNRAYFAALRDTPLSLHEVSDIRPGETMVLRDLLADTGPVTVHETSATRSLRQWDRIAVRVVPERDHHVISGALLPFCTEAVESLFAGLRDIHGIKAGAALRLSRDQLLGCAPIFTSAWLFTELERALDPAPPQITNSDGDDVLFHDLRFPLASRVPQKDLAERQTRVKGFRPEGRRFWNWLAPRKGRTGAAAGGIMLDSRLEGATVLGTAELKGRALLVAVNSARRAEQAEALVTAAAEDLLRPPLTTIRTVAQMQEDPRNAAPPEADAIPPEIARQLLRDYLDQHYRETLDMPIPMLDGISPREAVRSAAGRDMVVEWLKTLEKRSAAHGESVMAEYDFGWMWDELGLAAHRK